MDPSAIAPIADVLSASSPYGVLVFLSWFLFRLQDKKDKEIRDLYQKVVELSEAQTAAITKVESALNALRDAIDRL